MFIYPLAITLIVLSILNPVIGKQKDIYKWTTGLTIIAAFFDLCKALPEYLQSNVVIKALINFANLYLPGFKYGFGWIIPSICVFIIGLTIYFINRKERRII